MTRRIIIGLGAAGGVAAEANKEVYTGHTVSEALGNWCYHNRESLGLSIELLRPNGVTIKAPATSRTPYTSG